MKAGVVEDTIKAPSASGLAERRGHTGKERRRGGPQDRTSTAAAFEVLKLEHFAAPGREKEQRTRAV